MNIIYWNRFKIIAISILVIILIFVTAYIKVDTGFDTLPNQIQSTVLNQGDGQAIRVGIIGDSWVAGQKLDQSIHDSLRTAGIDASVISFGHPGAKSRQIFRNLLSESAAPYSSRSLWEGKHLNYMIILAGVNDSAGHIGAEFYGHHMLNIVKFTQSIGAFPIIVEVPEYDIENAPPEGALSFVKRLLYKALYDGMQDDVIVGYRHALSEKLNTLPKNSYLIVKFDPFIKDYSEAKNLYANALHLNKQGYQRLGTYIGTQLVMQHKKSLVQQDSLNLVDGAK